MKWGFPPRIKIYEALGALADGRVALLSQEEARVFSSSGGKFYTVRYNQDRQVIMANDNGSYWQGYLGYPAIAFLLVRGEIEYTQEISQALKGIPWKDLNTKFKNDFTKTLLHVREKVAFQGVALEDLDKEIASLEDQIKKLNLGLLGKKERPPAGY